MGHGDCFDNEYEHVPESRQRAGEGEREYFEHVRGYRVSSADNMLVIAAFAFLLCLGFGIHLSRAPAPVEDASMPAATLASQMPDSNPVPETSSPVATLVSRMQASKPAPVVSVNATWCDDRRPYMDTAC
jgi:hypothetical protein